MQLQPNDSQRPAKIAALRSEIEQDQATYDALLKRRRQMNVDLEEARQAAIDAQEAFVAETGSLDAAATARARVQALTDAIPAIDAQGEAKHKVLSEKKASLMALENTDAYFKALAQAAPQVKALNQAIDLFWSKGPGAQYRDLISLRSELKRLGEIVGASAYGPNGYDTAFDPRRSPDAQVLEGLYFFAQHSKVAE